MITLSESIIFLSIALLTITVSIFVFALSLLGRGIEEAKEEQKKVQSEHEEEIKRIKDEIGKIVVKKGLEGLAQDLRKSIKTLIKSKKEAKRKLKYARRYESLDLQESVVVPALFFLGAFFWSIFAKILAETAHTIWVYPCSGFSLLLLFLGSFRIYKCLKIIQEVTITTHKAYLKETAEAFRSVLEEQEEKKRPKLELKFTGRQPPFSFQKDSEEEISFFIRLTRGDIAKNTEVHFFIPPGNFEFPGKRTWSQTLPGVSLPNYLTTSLKYGYLRKGLWKPGKIKVKIPSVIGRFTLVYRLYCDGFVTDYQKFDVEVK